MKCERWIIQHDRAWDKEKYMSPRQDSNPWPPELMAGALSPTRTSRRVRSFNWVHMWQASCMRPCLTIFWNPGRKAENAANSKQFLTKFELFKLWSNTVACLICLLNRNESWGEKRGNKIVKMSLRSLLLVRPADKTSSGLNSVCLTLFFRC